MSGGRSPDTSRQNIPHGHTMERATQKITQKIQLQVVQHLVSPVHTKALISLFASHKFVRIQHPVDCLREFHGLYTAFLVLAHEVQVEAGIWTEDHPYP